MKLMNGQSGSAWKTVVSLLFCALALSACKKTNETNETNAGICNGEWALTGGYICDYVPIVGPVLCVFFGRDNDRDGAFRSGTRDECIVDGLKPMDPIDCNEMCRLNNNCSNIQCPRAENVEALKKEFSIKQQLRNNDPIKTP